MDEVILLGKEVEQGKEVAGKGSFEPFPPVLFHTVHPLFLHYRGFFNRKEKIKNKVLRSPACRSIKFHFPFTALCDLFGSSCVKIGEIFEIWKGVLDFPNYQISSLGRIRNINSNRILRPSLTCGYYKVRLSNKGIAKDYLVHHLVFKHFSKEKYNADLVIDHIDGNKLNNDFNNLRLLSRKENALMAYYKTNTNPAIKTVLQFDKDMNFIQEFQSVREAARCLNLDSSTISKVCRGVNKTHGGYIFKYKTQ